MSKYIDYNEAMKTEEGLLESLQNDVFRLLHNYKEDEGLSTTQLAENIGVTKGYISQILNGNTNINLRGLVKICSRLGYVPELNFITHKKWKAKQAKTRKTTEVEIFH